jgi:hypothetical protein
MPAAASPPKDPIGNRIFLASARSTPVGRAITHLSGSASAKSVRVGRRGQADPSDLGSRDHDPLVARRQQVGVLLWHVRLLQEFSKGAQQLDRALRRLILIGNQAISALAWPTAICRFEPVGGAEWSFLRARPNHVGSRGSPSWTHRGVPRCRRALPAVRGRADNRSEDRRSEVGRSESTSQPFCRYPGGKALAERVGSSRGPSR